MSTTADDVVTRSVLRFPTATLVTAALLALGGAEPPNAPAQESGATVIGQVVEPDGVTPVPDATVRVEGLFFSVRTDSAGRFRFSNLLPGQDTIRVTYAGVGLDRVPVELRGGDTLRVTLTAQRTLYEVADLTVTVEGNRTTIIPDFERRRRTGFGHYVTPEEIRNSAADDVTDYLRGVPGIRRDYGRFEERVTMRSPFGRGECHPEIYRNGNPAPGMELQDFSTEEVLALEVYTRPAQMPIQFTSAFSDCGAIVVWTE